MKNIFKKLLFGSFKSENDFLKDIPFIREFYEFNLTGNKRTHYQVQDWISPVNHEVEKAFENWDGKSPLFIDVPNNGKGYIESFNKAFKKEKIPKKLPEIGSLKLYKSSKVTDFILSDFLGSRGMFVSKKVKSILELYNVGKFNFYPVELEHNDIRYKEYYFFRCDNNIDRFIDVENSSFFSYKPLFDTNGKKSIKFKDEVEINNFLKRNEGKEYEDCIFIRSEQIVLQSDFPEMDLFFLKRFTFGGSKPFISKRLKEALSECSGIDFQLTNEVI